MNSYTGLFPTPVVAVLHHTVQSSFFSFHKGLVRTRLSSLSKFVCFGTVTAVVTQLLLLFVARDGITNVRTAGSPVLKRPSLSFHVLARLHSAEVALCKTLNSKQLVSWLILISLWKYERGKTVTQKKGM